jgi:hypothetical protein
MINIEKTFQENNIKFVKTYDDVAKTCYNILGYHLDTTIEFRKMPDVDVKLKIKLPKTNLTIYSSDWVRLTYWETTFEQILPDFISTLETYCLAMKNYVESQLDKHIRN